MVCEDAAEECPEAVVLVAEVRVVGGQGRQAGGGGEEQRQRGGLPVELVHQRLPLRWHMHLVREQAQVLKRNIVLTLELITDNEEKLSYT
jgi:hypothetical protein